jgi:hypothetical protein
MLVTLDMAGVGRVPPTLPRSAHGGWAVEADSSTLFVSTSPHAHARSKSPIRGGTLPSPASTAALDMEREGRKQRCVGWFPRWRGVMTWVQQSSPFCVYT